MGTPNKQQLCEKAKELYLKDCYRNGCSELAQTNPEYSELLENGYIHTARSMLMSANPHVVVIEKSMKSKKQFESSEFQFDLEELLRSGVFVSGQSGTGKSDVAMNLVDRLMKEGIICYVIDPSQDWMERSNVPQVCRVESVSQNIAIESESTIYDTSKLYVSEQRKFIEKFVERLYQFQIGQPKELRKWRIVVFEEAQLVYPNGCFRSNKKSSSLQLVSVGRNYRLRFIAVTPFSANVDKMLVKMCGQRCFGSTSEYNDLKYLKGFLGEQVYQLTTLDNGQFVYHYPKKRKVSRIYVKPHKRTVKLNVLRTLHSVFPELTKPKRQNTETVKALTNLFIALIWFVAFLIGVSQL